MNGPSTPDLWEVLAPLSAAASVGTLATILVALRQIHPEVRFEYDLLSFAAGAVGALAAWWMGRGLWRLGRSGVEGEDRRRLRLRVVWGFVILGILIMAGFAIAASGIPDGRRRDMVAGGLIAMLVLTAVGWLVWRLARLFGRPDDPAEGVS